MFLCTGENFSREYSGWFVMFVGNFWRKKYLRNYCPLVLKIGTRHAGLTRGSAFACEGHSVGGVILCILSMLGAVCFSL
jgi:hypothetical protein